MNKVPKKQASKAKKKKLSKKIRTYNNTSRVEKSEFNRKKIIEMYISMLVEKKGQDLSLEELAQKANLSTRTLFRFFGDKKSLTAELEKYLAQYLKATSEKLAEMSLEEFSTYVYGLFDDHKNLIKAYLYTNLGQTSRALLRKKFNHLLLQKLYQEVKLTESEGLKKKMFLIVTLINASIWEDLNQSFTLSGRQMSSTIKWAISTLIKNLNFEADFPQKTE